MSFEVTLSINASNRSEVDRLLDKMYDGLSNADYDKIGDPTSIKDEDERYYEERISYVEDWHGEGEHYIFEGKWSDEESWGLDTACKLFDYEGEKGVLISYQALTKIRELQRMHIPYYFK